MTTLELLQRSIDYIENNLKSELTLAELAEVTGFSTYHFSHLFYDFVGMPVSAYITKRRLYCAIFEIQNSKKLIDTALLYGYDTHAGFYKAFKREFGCSPTKYLKINTVKRSVQVNLIKEGKIVLTQTRVRQLLKQWDIDNKLEISSTFTAGGAFKNKDTWKIGDKYVFKTGKNISGLKTHIAISRTLQKSGMVAASPITTKNGDDFIIEDDSFFVLTNQIKGGFLPPDKRYDGDRFEIGKKYGNAIGRLHKILQKYDKQLEVNDSNLFNTVMDWAMPETKKIMEQWDCPLPEEFYEDYIKNFSKLYKELPRHIIHRDANPSNIMFDNGEFTGFIDFNISERNVRIFDPCYCATGILSEAGDFHDCFENWSELLAGIINGYNLFCKLSDIERQSIPYVIYSIQMIFIAWLVEHEVYKKTALQNRRMLMWIWENREKCFKGL